MRVSVIVVSRNRDNDLKRLLALLKYQQGISFDLIVVTNTSQRDVASFLGGSSAKYVFCDTANISIMRNIGLSVSQTELVAFIDDDAIPEPDWLLHLIEPLAQSGTVSATGPVMTHTGTSLHYGVTWSDLDGVDVSHDAPPKEVVHLHQQAGKFPRAQGCNVAYVREALEHIGRFDPQFAYYLDETDVSLRLAKAGNTLGFAPRAIVQHLSASNETRSATRRPTSWTLIGQSIDHFTRKHCQNPQSAKRKHFKAFENRLLRALGHGFLEPRDVTKLRRQLATAAPSQPMSVPDIEMEQLGHRDFMDAPRDDDRISVVFSSHDSQNAMDEAKQAIRAGKVVYLFEVESTFSRHHRVSDGQFYHYHVGRFRSPSGSWRFGSVEAARAKTITEYDLEHKFDELVLK
ncbi:MAG: glycosyltransferase [Pseudomonadota bacterium]